MDNYNYNPEEDNNNSNSSNNQSTDGWKNPYDSLNNQNNRQADNDGWKNPYDNYDYSNNTNQNQNGDNWKNPYSDGPKPNFSSNRPTQTGHDGFAIASLVLGIISIPAVITIYFGIIFGVAAIVLALISRGRTNHRFDGLAIGGLVTGIIGIIFVILIIVIFVQLISNPDIMEMLNKIMMEYQSV